MVTKPELSGVAIVAAGAFNPAIIHPRWLADRELIPESVADHALTQSAQQLIVSQQLAIFVGDWLSVRVTPQQAVFSTVDEGRSLDLRDLVQGIFDLLPETPVDGLGINSDTHFRTESEAAWHEFGDQFLPKDFWEPLFEDGDWRPRPDGKHVGMRVMTVEVYRDDGDVPGFVRIELAPSVRVTPNGVYIGINDHYQLTTAGEDRGTAIDATNVLSNCWNAARDLENRLVSQLLEAV